MTTPGRGRDGLPGSRELLWGRRQRSAPGPKPALDLDRIARAAIAVADEEGLAALSMRRVAERLGVTTMALYRYLPGKTELLDLMLDAAIGEPPALGAEAGDWRAGLERWALANYALFHRHPWLLPLVANRSVVGPNEVAWTEAALRALAGSGLPGDEMLGIVLLVNGYVRGAAQLALGAAEQARRAGITTEQWWATFGGLWEEVAAEERYPALAAATSAARSTPPTEDEPAASWRFGLQRVLDGVEAFIQTRSAPAPG